MAGFNNTAVNMPMKYRQLLPQREVCVHPSVPPAHHSDLALTLLADAPVMEVARGSTSAALMYASAIIPASHPRELESNSLS